MNTYAGKRRVLRLAGGDVRDFLQGLVSNDVARLDRGLVYAAMLTPQGKLIADFFLQADGADVLMDLPAELAEGLAKFKQPKELIFLDELPRNTMGKVQKKALRDQYSKQFTG
mgnify:CR=1 FL=1